NIRASLVFETDKWEIQNASLQHAGGNFSLSASFNALKNGVRDATAKFKLDQVDVRKVFYAFDNFGQDAIIGSNIRGTLNTNGDIHFLVNKKGNFQSKSLSGTMNFSLKNGALVNFKPFENINDIVFKNRDFSDVQFAEINNKLSISKGEMQINRMEIASTVLHIYVEGLYDFNHKNTDISIQVPLNNLSKSKNDTRKEKKGIDAKTGASVYLRARNASDGSVKFGLDVFRKLRKNKN
ncbi:MAG: AsmA-like C-terminal region-containing protein, partial [Chitinophagaceae bacterium]